METLKEVATALVIVALIMTLGIATGTSLGSLFMTYIPIPGFK